MTQTHCDVAETVRPRMEALSLSSEKLELDGVYLLENGVDAFIYIGKEAPSAVVQDLLGATPKAVSCYTVAGACHCHVPMARSVVGGGGCHMCVRMS